MARSTDDIVSVAEAARRLARNPDTIKSWIRRGVFPGYMPSPGVYIIPRVAFDRYLAGEFRPQASQPEPLRLVEGVA